VPQLAGLSNKNIGLNHSIQNTTHQTPPTTGHAAAPPTLPLFIFVVKHMIAPAPKKESINIKKEHQHIFHHHNNQYHDDPSGSWSKTTRGVG
jgi:hypothetical protein